MILKILIVVSKPAKYNPFTKCLDINLVLVFNTDYHDIPIPRHIVSAEFNLFITT